MVTGIAIYDVNLMDLVKQMLLSIGTKDVGDTWIKSTSKNCKNPFFAITLFIVPLPFIAEFCLILRFIVGRIQITRASSKTSIHKWQVLIWQGHIDNHIRLHFLNQRNNF